MKALAALLLPLPLCVLPVSRTLAVGWIPSGQGGSGMDVSAGNELHLGVIILGEKWMSLAALVLAVIGVAALMWVAIAVSKAAHERARQTRQLGKIADSLRDGIAVRAPLRVEQVAWPRDAHLRIDSVALERMAAQNDSQEAKRIAAQPKAGEQDPVCAGEEPELLALASRLAGVVSETEWFEIVKGAGLRAVLLQSNPTEQGAYIADNSGYSIFACLLRGEQAQIGYVLPSYQDPNASEARWSEFFEVNEDTAVRNYRIDRLAVMRIERELFYLPQMKGRMTRRPQFY